MKDCHCEGAHVRRRIVLTGGPGAGKTAVLELIRHSFCEHLKVLPEAAGIVFGGGFPRSGAPECQRAAQRAIFYVERELEVAADAENPAVILCDRGTVDGAAYWPGPGDLWSSVETTLAEQLRRYDAVIHLRTPSLESGYSQSNPLRTESAAAAAAIDDRIAQLWEQHPQRFIVPATKNFLDKVRRVLEILEMQIPECCRHQLIPLLEEPQGETAGVSR